MIVKRSNLFDVAVQAASSFVGRACYLVLQIFLARMLGPREFGLYAIGWTVVGLVSAIAPLGMPQAVIRFEAHGRGMLTSLPLALVVLTGSMCCALLAIAAGPLARVVFNEPDAASAILAMAPSIPPLCVFFVLSASLRSSGRNAASGVLGALVFIVYLAATLILFVSPAARAPAGAGWTYTFAVLLTTAVAFVLCLGGTGCRTKVAIRPLLSFGVVTMVIHTASILNLQVDRLLLGVMTNAGDVGLYQVASQLAMIALVFRVAVLSVFEARVPKARHQADVTREFVASSRILLHICAPGLLCLAVAAGPWISAFFGDAYADAAGPLAILVFGQCLQFFAGPSLTALHMTGDERAAMWITLLATAINVIGNVILIPVFGLLGSASVTSVMAVLAAFAGLRRLRGLGCIEGISGSFADILIGTGIAIVPPVAARSFGVSSPFALIAVTLLSYLFYGLTVAKLKNVEDETFDLIRTLAFGCLKMLLARFAPRQSVGCLTAYVAFKTGRGQGSGAAKLRDL